MKIKITNIEEKVVASNNTAWRKIYVLNPNNKTQWFMVAPWHYEKAKLMDNFNLLMSVSVDDELDIKYRNGKIGDNTVTFITSIKKVVEETFSWEGEEMDSDEQKSSQNAPQEATHHYNEPEPDYDPFKDEIPF